MGGRILREKNEVAQRLGVPEAGRLHIGEKKMITTKTGRQMEIPTSLDYFKPADDHYSSLFTQALGEKPNLIKIIFPSDDAELVCNERYLLLDKAGKTLAEGDGHEFIVWNGETRIVMTTDKFPNLMESLVRKYSSTDFVPKWKVSLTLRFLVPAVQGIWGYWQLSTSGSASSIPQVRDVFDSFLEKNGKVAGCIFDLSVKKVKSGKPGDNSTYPVLHLVPNESKESIEQVKAWLKPVAQIEG